MLANFIPAYQRLIIEVTGKNLFHPDDDKNPPTWNWPQLRGYTKEEISEVWSHIKVSHDFNVGLGETPDCSTLRMCVLDLMRFHDIYYITSRVGQDVKWQTELWLRQHLGIDLPTVLISSAKGLCAKALKLDCYIDDNLDNVNDVVMKTLPELKAELITTEFGSVPYYRIFEPNAQPATRTYLLNKSYNTEAEGPCDVRVIRVNTLGQFLDRELQNL